MNERAGEIEPALHPARISLRASLGGIDEADELEQLLHACPCGGSRDPIQTALQLEQLTSGLHRVEADLLQSDTDPPSYGARIGEHINPEDPRATGRRRQQRAEHAHSCGLAGAVWPQKAEHFTLRYIEVDLANSVDLTLERPSQAACLDCACRAAVLSRMHG